MEDRYAKAIIDELERIGDLLADLLNLERAKLEASGFKGNLPQPIRRRPAERRAAKADTAAARERP